MNYTVICIIWESRAMTPTFFSTFLMYLKFQYNIKRAKEKKALKLNKHNQFNHTPKMVKSIYLLFCEKLHTTQSKAD